MPIEELTCRVKQVVHDRNGFAVVKAMTRDRKLVTLRGAAVSGLREGEWINAKAEGQTVPKYGFGYFVKEQSRLLNGMRGNTLADFSKWMVKNLPGVGPKAADGILSRYDSFEEARDYLLVDPKPISNVVKGSHRVEAVEVWRRESGRLEWDVLLTKAQVGPKTRLRVAAHYGGETQAMEILLSEPWRVAMEVSGIGFRKMDEFARVRGIPMDAPERLRCGAAFVANELSQRFGHTIHPKTSLFREAAEYLSKGADRDILPAEIRVAVQGHRDLLEEVGDSFLGAANLVRAEKAIASMVNDFRQFDGLDIPVSILDKVAQERGLDSFQRQVLSGMANHAISILTGGPGTGKTTSMGAFVEACKRSGVTIHLVAPTGLAARVLSRAAKHPAYTIHRWIWLIEQRQLDDPDVLVVEESSMLSSALAGRMVNTLRAVANRVIFIGDGDQLPPVEAGRVFRDLIDSKAVHTFRLEKIYRQAGDSYIPLVARALKEGLLPQADPDIGAENVGWKIIECDLPEQVAREGLIEALGQSGRFSIDESVSLAPHYKKTAGVDEISTTLQRLLNKHPAKVLDGREGRWCLGDPVMALGNDYNAQHAPLTHAMRGTIVDIEPRVSPPVIHIKWEDGNTRSHEAPDGKMSRVVSGWCLTYHRSQGSQFAGVVVFLCKHHVGVANREAIYTAITRARQEAILVVEKGALAAVLAIEGSARRTALPIYLRQIW